MTSGSVDRCRILRDFYDAGFVCFFHVSVASAVSCVVSEWTEWSGCAKPCVATVRRRNRTILQEPLNAGKPCPHLEEQAGCAEYWSQQQHCHNSLGEFLHVLQNQIIAKATLSDSLKVHCVGIYWQKCLNESIIT